MMKAQLHVHEGWGLKVYIGSDCMMQLVLFILNYLVIYHNVIYKKWLCFEFVTCITLKDICNTILKVLKLMTASFCKRNSPDNEEINHYLTHLLKQDMIPFEEGGWVRVMSHDYTI